jgi:hypothetical protein
VQECNCHGILKKPASLRRNNNMDRFLAEYINRMKPHFTSMPAATAHEIASAFLAYRFGLFPNVVQECNHAISHIPDGESNNVLKKALAIVRANAQNLDNAQFLEDLSIQFSDNETPYLPINLPIEKIEDPGSYELDNALVLIYTVASITSPEDEEIMAEHHKFIIRLLTGYKKALGIT